jgi:hypothetical protein
MYVQQRRKKTQMTNYLRQLQQKQQDKLLSFTSSFNEPELVPNTDSELVPKEESFQCMVVTSTGKVLAKKLFNEYFNKSIVKVDELNKMYDQPVASIPIMNEVPLVKNLTAKTSYQSLSKDEFKHLLAYYMRPNTYR